jgi:hypothetical protein
MSLQDCGILEFYVNVTGAFDDVACLQLLLFHQCLR